MFVRTRFQYGSLRLRMRERSSDVWEFRYYETTRKANGRGRAVRFHILTLRQPFPDSANLDRQDIIDINKTVALAKARQQEKLRRRPPRTTPFSDIQISPTNIKNNSAY